VKKISTLPDLCVSSLRRGHANLLCIVPILMDDPRRESVKSCFLGCRTRDIENCTCLDTTTQALLLLPSGSSLPWLGFPCLAISFPRARFGGSRWRTPPDLGRPRFAEAFDGTDNRSRCIAILGTDVSLLDKVISEGENPAWHLQSSVYGVRSKGHTPRNWSATWVVNFIWS